MENLYSLIGKTVKEQKGNLYDLTSQNLKYVWKVASDISFKTGVDLYDLFVEGVIGMKKAEENYDPTQNNDFVKYSATSVRGYMLNLVNRQSEIVHVPANHKMGFRKGQVDNESVGEISYDHIDSYDYDTLGTCDHENIFTNREEILNRGLETLDENGRIAIKMKLRMGEYVNLEKNNMNVIAEELEVPVNIANKIYKEAMKKLTKYCTKEVSM